MIALHHLFWRLFTLDTGRRRLGRETQTRPSRDIAMQAHRRADRNLGIR
jgi:hypothetical protein